MLDCRNGQAESADQIGVLDLPAMLRAQAPPHLRKPAKHFRIFPAEFPRPRLRTGLNLPLRLGEITRGENAKTPEE